MGYQEKFTEEDVNELLADDLSLAASLATLILENGDIRSFLLNKLRERQQAIEEYELSQQTEAERKWHKKGDYMDTYFSYPIS